MATGRSGPMSTTGTRSICSRPGSASELTHPYCKETSVNRLLNSLGAAALLVMSTLAAAQQQGITDTEILIGDVMPLTGPPALGGIAHNIGVRVAVAEVNAAGGINGRKVR